MRSVVLQRCPPPPGNPTAFTCPRTWNGTGTGTGCPSSYPGSGAASCPWGGTPYGPGRGPDPGPGNGSVSSPPSRGTRRGPSCPSAPRPSAGGGQRGPLRGTAGRERDGAAPCRRTQPCAAQRSPATPPGPSSGRNEPSPRPPARPRLTAVSRSTRPRPRPQRRAAAMSAAGYAGKARRPRGNFRDCNSQRPPQPLPEVHLHRDCSCQRSLPEVQLHSRFRNYISQRPPRLSSHCAALRAHGAPHPSARGCFHPKPNTEPLSLFISISIFLFSPLPSIYGHLHLYLHIQSSPHGCSHSRTQR